MIMILGYIFAVILSVIVVWPVYHIVRGLVIGIDLMRWKLTGYSLTDLRRVKSYKWKLIKMWLDCWYECIGYDGSVTYRTGNSRWSGYGTGRVEPLDNQ